MGVASHAKHGEQLPPIGEDNGILADPHVFLDEVMRQALESDIIKLSMDIRAGKPLVAFDGNDVKVIRRENLVTGMYLWADQIIVGRNNTRRMVNAQMRTLLGKGSEPEVGDKVICLKNYWDETNGCGEPLINGMIGTLEYVDIGEDRGAALPRNFRASFLPDFHNKEEDDAFFYGIGLDYGQMVNGVSSVAKDARPQFIRGKKIPLPYSFDYGYAITCWKAQGSQFNKVLFFAERVGRMSEVDYAKFVYTAITRAVEKVVIVI